MKPEVSKKFFESTDDTGRFIVKSARTGRTYACEPIGNHRTNWGSINPGEEKLMHKKGDGKHRGAIDEKDSLITETNGFINIKLLEPGDSPLMQIEMLDAQYPDKV